jgi:predicted dehydrogenase
VGIAAVNAGKSIYNEKPLSIELDEAQKILDAAKKSNARVGCAPDTFMGPGIQTCRKLIDEGWIGKPVAVNAFMMSHGVEHWHPSPEFYYKKGGGPLFDMGPYYLTCLVSLLGGVRRVCGSSQIGEATRTITSAKYYGKKIDVETPTHIAGVLDFESGAVGTIITSFDIWSHSMPCIEIYGTEGVLQVPDPNFFRGEVKIKRFRDEKWNTIPLILKKPDEVSEYADWDAINNYRGIGITDMAEAITENRKHRASGELAYHVLEIMHGIINASDAGVYYSLKSKIERPEAFL